MTDGKLVLDYEHLFQAMKNIKSLKDSVDSWGLKQNLEKIGSYLERLHYVYVNQKAYDKDKLLMTTLDMFKNGEFENANKPKRSNRERNNKGYTELK